MPQPEPWVTIGSRIALEDRWLRVRADECRTAGGRTISPYYVIDVPDFAHIAALTDDNRFVMVRQYRQGTRAVHLELPAGVIDSDDGSPLDAARRELLEETGYVAREWRQLAVWSANPARQGNSQHLFLARGATWRSGQNLDGAESITVELVAADDMLRLVLDGRIDSSQHVAAVLRTLIALQERDDGAPA